MSDELCERFVAAFRKGIEAEKAALRADAAAFEVPLEQGRALEGGIYSFSVPRPSDRLSPGVQCGIRDAAGFELPVTLLSVDGAQLTLQSEAALTPAQSSYRLIFVPWFLYDAMKAALVEVPFPRTALRAFGKLPAERRPLPPVVLDSALNESQRGAVQQALESQLTVLWGPPGTGKTTTLAQLVANLARLERRLLIASTTHAALDQVLERLSRTPSLIPLMQAGRVVRLGYSPNETFGCALGEVVQRTQVRSRRQLERGLAGQQTAAARRQRLASLLERCAQAAATCHQLDLFAEESLALQAGELEPCFAGPRAVRLAGLSPDRQLQVLARHDRRLQGLEKGYREKAGKARQALVLGQQKALNEARIVLSTLANTYVSPMMKEQEFDCAILEEAGMALLPAAYLAAGKAREQVVVVGDPQQLPAILASRDPFAQQTLGRTLFEVLGDRPERVMLEVQYRMHESIGRLVSGLFYGDSLRHAAGPEVLELAERAPFPGRAVVVLDCPGRCAVEPGDYSRVNHASAMRAAELARQAAAAGSSVAVIAPYRKQVRRIQELLGDADVHCATVHRFQGQERDVVVLDVVDAPPLEPGTLLGGRGPRSASANLLNVSLSRARGKLILIADVTYVRTRAAGTILHQVLEAAAALA